MINWLKNLLSKEIFSTDKLSFSFVSSYFSQVWFNDDMFKEEFCFFKGYAIPKASVIDEFREAILQLPNMDSPEVFGLHTNADIT